MFDFSMLVELFNFNKFFRKNKTIKYKLGDKKICSRGKI